MSILHVVSSQTFYQIQNDSHVGDFFSNSLPTFNKPDLFVNLLDLIGEDLVLFDENVSFDLSPEFGFPVIILKVDKRYQIP